MSILATATNAGGTGIAILPLRMAPGPGAGRDLICTGRPAAGWLFDAHTIFRHRRNRYARAPRPPALGTFSYARGGGAGNHLDSRRARSDAGRCAVRRAEGKSDAALHQRRRWIGRQRLSSRRRPRRRPLRLATRPAGPLDTLLRDR